MSALPQFVASVLIALPALPLAIAPRVSHAEEGNGIKTNAAKNERFPTVIRPGAKGELIFDLHATLNEVMREKEVSLPADYTVSGNAFTTPDGTRIPVPSNWMTPSSIQPSPDIDLPEEPIDSFGIYGPQTYALVMLFQIDQDLPPTGKVDAVTLHHLRPLQPFSRPLLARVMSIVSPERDNDEIEWEKFKAAVITALLAIIISVIVFLLFRYAAYMLNRYLERRQAAQENGSAKSQLLPHLQKWRLFQWMAHLAPAVVIYSFHWVYPDYWVHEVDSVPWWEYPGTFLFWNGLFARVGLSYVILSLMFVTLTVVRALETSLTPEDTKGPAALSGIMRFTRGAVRAVTVLLIGAALTGINPLVLVGSLGVFMAVFVMLFRDSLLGLVACMQIVSNNVLNVGDWIEMPKYGADGDVQALSLSMIKVQNFDKTISTVPTHAVLSESFRNWRNMHEGGGRRIKRAIFIDMHSIKPCSSEMTARFQQKLADVMTCMAEDKSSEASEKWLNTNIGAFRKYIVGYLQSLDNVHPSQKMTFLVRHLHPTAKGLPLEIYAFCSKTEWIEYEAIQADIFEHVLSMLPQFDLRVFQDRSNMREDRGESREQPVQS